MSSRVSCFATHANALGRIATALLATAVGMLALGVLGAAPPARAVAGPAAGSVARAVVEGAALPFAGDDDEWTRAAKLSCASGAAICIPSGGSTTVAFYEPACERRRCGIETWSVALQGARGITNTAPNPNPTTGERRTYVTFYASAAVHKRHDGFALVGVACSRLPACVGLVLPLKVVG